MLGRMLQHQFECILPGLLAQVSENGDVASDDRLERSAEISEDASRPDDDAADDSHVSDNTIPREFVCGAHHDSIHATIHWILLHGYLLVRFYTLTILFAP